MSPAIGATAPAIAATTPAIAATTPAIGPSASAISSTTPRIGATAFAIGATTHAMAAAKLMIGATALAVYATRLTIGAASLAITAPMLTISATTLVIPATAPEIGTRALAIAARAPRIAAAAITIPATAFAHGVRVLVIAVATLVIGATALVIGATTLTNGARALMIAARALVIAAWALAVSATALAIADTTLDPAASTLTLGSAVVASRDLRRPRGRLAPLVVPRPREFSPPMARSSMHLRLIPCPTHVTGFAGTTPAEGTLVESERPSWRVSATPDADDRTRVGDTTMARTQFDLLRAGQVFLSNATKDDEVRSALQAQGFPVARLESGTSLLDKAMSTHSERELLLGRQMTLTVGVDEAFRTAQSEIASLTFAAQNALAERPDLLARVGLSPRRRGKPAPAPEVAPVEGAAPAKTKSKRDRRTIPAFLSVARPLVDNALKDVEVLVALLDVGYEEDDLRRIVESLDRLERADEAQEASKGVAKGSDRAWGQHWNKFRQWYFPMVRRVRRALGGRPDLLAKLGIAA